MDSPALFDPSDLNPPQFEAVTYGPGPQLILAGAGSGKTRVLTFKIAWLIKERGLRPWEILAVTFTNKAAQEMRQRIAGLIGYAGNLKWVGTFHSICARLLRFHATRLGYTSNFTIFDTDDQKRFIKGVLKDEKLEDNSHYSVDVVRGFIGRHKNQGLTVEQAALEAEDEYGERMARLYRKYNETLLKNNGMDFDDLIFLAIRLLESHPEIREVFSSGFRYVLIDEYQDTNKAQYRLIRLLVGAHHNLVAVGDDDQSIYGWRGADIGNILSFRKDFPEAHVTKLEQNYRSTANILGVAASVIRNNKNRMDKTIWTANPPGEKISLLELDDELLEAAWVARRILAQSAFKPGDTAVFYRTNAQSRVLEDELRRQRIPYLIVGGTRFYERREVKDLMAYLRVLSNPQDSASLARILNVPKRGIGDKSIRTVELYAAENGISLFDGLRRARASGLADAAAKRILEFTVLIGTLRALAAQEPLPALIAEIINRTGYKAHLEDEGTEEALDRLANVEELVSAAQDFLRRRADGEIEAARDPDAAEAERFQRALELKFPLPGMEPGPAAGGLADEAADGGPAEGRDAAAPSLDFFGDALPGGDSGRNASVTQAGPEPGSPEAARLEDLDLFLQEISLLADTDGLKATQEAVTLMTVHSAKGLEFPRVFVTGLEDGLFPMLREEDEDEVEEERRLFYVAATRARKELSLTYARRRRRYGLYQESHGSRFLGEIDRKFLEIARPSLPPSPFARAADREARSWGGYGGYSGGYGGGGSRGTSGFAGRDGESHGVSSTPAYEDFSQEQEEGFRKGQKVAHDKFGEGTVVATDGHGDSARVHVMFADHVRRVLMVKFAKLKTLAR